MILKYWKVILIVIFIGVMCGLFFLFMPKKPEGPEQKPQKSYVLVESEPVTVTHFQEDLVSVGTTVANESVVLRPEVEGKIIDVLFKPGTHVEKAEKLIKFDDGILQAQLKEAEAQLTLSKLEYERAKTLADKKAGSIKDMQKAMATFEVHKAGVQAAKEKLQKALLTAPFEGLVGMKDVSIGAYVRPGEDLVVLEDVDPIKVDFNVGETYLQELKVGMPVKIKIDGFPRETFIGKIEAIDARVDALSHSIRARATLDNPSNKLRSGLFSSVALTLKDDATAVMVPESAIEQRNGETTVYRIVDGVAVETPVTIGSRRDGMVVIEEGLLSFDEVATAGASRLFNGAPVKTIPSSRLKDEKKTGVSQVVEKLKHQKS